MQVSGINNYLVTYDSVRVLTSRNLNFTKKNLKFKLMWKKVKLNSKTDHKSSILTEKNPPETLVWQGSVCYLELAGAVLEYIGSVGQVLVCHGHRQVITTKVLQANIQRALVHLKCRRVLDVRWLNGNKCQLQCSTVKSPTILGEGECVRIRIHRTGLIRRTIFMWRLLEIVFFLILIPACWARCSQCWVGRSPDPRGSPHTWRGAGRTPLWLGTPRAWLIAPPSRTRASPHRICWP